ncbi:hypothetical protein M0805_002559 [Coniferiporia weirii]|nr:hypothetical protein M0805_002559 [Coniferiporia weirii]
MKIAVQGCCHGELDAIYNQITQLERRNNYKVDCLLICGDFQAIRNNQDLQCMAVPDKYKRLGGFYRYYTGEKEAPVLTLVIGGNHEASNYMWELYHGGWLAPNIYFLGFAGCVQVNGVKIAGASGIYSANHYRLGHYETIPYDNGSMRSIYHIREYDIFRLLQLTSVDIFLSHDWPAGITRHGDADDLLRRKPYFRTDIQTGKLGSPPAMQLLQELKPQWWFAAHLHCRFEATVVHGSPREAQEPTKVDNPDEIVIDDFDDAGPSEGDKETGGSLAEPVGSAAVDRAPAPETNPDEILLEDEMEDVVQPPPVQSTTKFLALDKCLPRRHYLEVIDIPSSDSPEMPRLTFDPEWLAITRAFHTHLSTERAQLRLPEAAQAAQSVKRELEWVQRNVGDKEKCDGVKDVHDCQVFWPTAPGPGNEGPNKFMQPPWYTNPQTEAFCGLLELKNKVNPVPKGIRFDPPPVSEQIVVPSETETLN